MARRKDWGRFLRDCPRGGSISLGMNADLVEAADLLDAARAAGYERITYDDGMVVRFSVERLAEYLRHVATRGGRMLCVPDNASDQIFSIDVEINPGRKCVRVMVDEMVVVGVQPSDTPDED